MVQKNWKEKLNDMGIEIKEVRRHCDGSAIESWYTFEYKGIPVFTYILNYQCIYRVGVPPFPPYADEYKSEVKGCYCCTNFDHFIENIKDYISGTPENKRKSEEIKKKLEQHGIKPFRK